MNNARKLGLLEKAIGRVIQESTRLMTLGQTVAAAHNMTELHELQAWHHELNSGPDDREE